MFFVFVASLHGVVARMLAARYGPQPRVEKRGGHRVQQEKECRVSRMSLFVSLRNGTLPAVSYLLFINFLNFAFVMLFFFLFALSLL